MTENQIAAILKTGFLLRYFPKESLQDWGRFKVERGGGSAFFDLTFSHPKQGEFISILNKISGSDNNDELIIQYFFRFYRKTFLSNHYPTNLIEKEIIRFVEMDMIELSEDEALFFVQLDADHSLRKEGIEDGLPIDHLSFLDRYTKFDEIQSALSAESILEPTFPS